MPQYVSDGGVWHPAKEHAVLPHLAGTDKEVYDGPDRAAMEEMAKAYGVDEKGYPKETTFGMPFDQDPMLQDLARQLGYKSIMEYAVARGYDPIKAKAEFEKKAAKIEKYEPPKRQPERQIEGGGKDLSGQGKDRYGGLGDPPELK